MSAEDRKEPSVTLLVDVANDDLAEIPDRGSRAWIVVFGSTLALFSTFGIINSFGVFQDHYMDTLLSSSSTSTISLIGALQLFLVYGLGPIFGTVLDAHGTKIILPLGSLIVVLSLTIVSLCQAHQLYQFFIVQGLSFGVGSALIFTPSLAVLGQWFRRKRACVIGIAGAGASAGGVVYPILLQHLIGKIGFPWAVRVMALMAFVCLSIACLAVTTRHTRKQTSWGTIVDLHGFCDVQYSMAAVGAFLYFFALFIPYVYIQTYADSHGVSPVLSQYLLALVNALGIPARIIPGLLADRFGVLQILVPSSIISGLTVLVLWLPSRGSVPIVLFSALYGLFSGAFVSLLPAYIATRTSSNKFGARLGSVYICVAFATFAGTPVAGAFVSTTTQANFARLIIFTGVLLLAGGIILGLAHIKTLAEKRTAAKCCTS